jgi:amino acid transporter
MSSTAVTAAHEPEPEHGASLQRNALSLAGSIVIALGSAGPTASIALTLAALEASTGFASPVAVLICGVPMLGIALAYRRLNHWHVNCGGTYIWAGRAISPYLGFMIGWMIILAYFIGAMSIVLPIGSYALQLFHNSYQDSGVAQALIESVALAFVTVVAYLGIKATARVQWLLIGIEYTAITLLSLLCLISVFGGNARSVGFDWSWFSWSTLGGTSGIVAGGLIAVYMYSGWDTAILLNEETEDAAENPGRAVIVSVLVLAFLYSFFTFAYQGAVTPHQLQAHGTNALAYLGTTVTGSWLGKWLILAVLLSGVGSALASIVSGARVLFAMSYDRVLPPVFSRTHPVHQTPTVATLLGAAIAGAVLWLYALGSSSVQTLFDTIVSIDGLLFALFYSATGIAVAVYYRRLAVAGLREALELAVLPLGSALFLLYIAYRSVPGLGGWGSRNMEYLYVMLLAGVAVMLYSRSRKLSSYFDLPLEAYDPDAGLAPAAEAQEV